MAGTRRINERYRVIRPLGSGSQGDVLLVADDQRSGALRALKLMPAVGRTERARLIGEFQRLSVCQHPALTRVYDLGVLADDDTEWPVGTAFFTAEYVAGSSPVAALAEALAAGGAEAAVATLLAVAEDVAAALAHLHASGLVHRDVKPANIIVSDASGPAPAAKLLDLGLSTARGIAGHARGTLAYMAPEALTGQVDPRSDLYSLGATLYHAVAGRPPFLAAEPKALIRAICGQALSPCAASWLPAQLSELINHLLERDPGHRHSAATVLLDEVARAREALGQARRRPRDMVAASTEVTDGGGESVRADSGRSASSGRYPAALLPPRLVGRRAILSEVRAAFEAITDSSKPTRLVRLLGAAGSGRRAIVTAAVRSYQLAAAVDLAPPLAFLRGTPAQLARGLGALERTDDEPERRRRWRRAMESEIPAERAAERALFTWVERFLEAARARAPAVLIVEPGADDARAAALVRAALAGHRAFADGLLLVASLRRESDSGLGAVAGAVDIEVPPLTASESRALIESMVGRSVARAWCTQLARAASGSPRIVVEAIRAAAARAGIDQIESIAIDELMTELLDAGQSDSLAGLVSTRIADLSGAHADLLYGLAVLDGRASVEQLAAVVGAELSQVHARLAVLRTQGFVGGDEPETFAVVGSGLRSSGLPVLEVTLPSSAHTEAIHRSIPAARRRALHRAALAQARAAQPGSGQGMDPVVRARHLIETGPVHKAVAACADSARALWQRGDLERALAAARFASERASGRAAVDACILHARIATSAGRYDEAVEVAQRCARSRTPGRRRQARFVLARALFKRGELDASERVLRALVSADEDGDDLAARGAYARLLVARGRHREALKIAVGDPEDAGLANLFATLLATDEDAESERISARDAVDSGRWLCLESAGLALLYTGELDGAERTFSALERVARAHDAQALLGRALSLRGMVEHARGKIAGAADLYHQAGECARAAGEVHAAAVYDINQATAHSERGLFGTAMGALSRARDALLRLGAVAELAAAQFNRGIALLALGQVAAARRATIEAHQYARAPRMRIYAHLLDGDTCRREGDRAAALGAYERAHELAASEGAPRELLLVLLELATTLAEDNDRRALDFLDRAREVASGPDGRDRLLLARARVALTLGGRSVADADRFTAPLAELAERTATSGRVDQAWRTEVICARLARALGDDRTAKRYCRQARARFEEVLASAPEVDREGMRGDPDACALSALSAELDLRRATPSTLASVTLDSRHTAAQLRRMLALSRRLNSQLQLEPLLSDVIDTAIEMTAAERGFLLLRERGQLRVVVARNFDQASLDGQDARMSRSMAERAARTGEVVMSVDAAFDERFESAESVAALRLRSVVAVPLRQKGRVIGTIYVDHRFRRSAFAEDAVELLQELADIAAVAIENARLVEESRRRQAEIVQLNRKLQAEVVEKETEIARLRLSPSHDGRDGLRHRYAEIVGRSPAMLDMLRVIDRAADTHLPVVIFGESGTGKELVARALHENSGRRKRPFVPVNCGALPAELLESELFGHARGAFTGADRDRRGLFDVAHLGTLFLDEIADTSAAMQTKLLRVLQEGEIRRVGDTRARRVDVRVVAASNRKLADLVAQGLFREDLFYRLHVLSIDVPPLRKRPQDIPLLAGHLLARLAGDRSVPQLTESALKRLCGYAWPGNVRELENQLARALALGGDIIGADDLSPEIRAEPRPAARDDLRIKPRVNALERQLVSAAMARTGDNQTAAAKLLGMSRYGLQKKLKRYGMVDAQANPAGPVKTE